MARIRVLVEIPGHPFASGEVVDSADVDAPHARVAHGFAEWVDGPPEVETATKAPTERATPRPSRPRTPRKRAEPKAKPAPAAPAPAPVTPAPKPAAKPAAKPAPAKAPADRKPKE